MTIRDFRTDDRDVVLSMVTAFYTSPGVSHPIPVEHFATVFDEMCNGGSARLRGLLIEANGAAAGFCSLSFSYSTEAGGQVVLIEEVFLSPAYRGQGLGGALFRWLKEEYRDTAARLRLEVMPDNTGAIALYRRLGFKELPYTQMVLEDF